ncbi:MAG: PQQ-dependent sugar dehydrogenase [Caldilineaceae bacterium]
MKSATATIFRIVAHEGHSTPWPTLAMTALYVANGDGLNYNYGSLRAQAIDSLAGKILRINPLTGDGYASNPFLRWQSTEQPLQVYVYGMKHPYRFASASNHGGVVCGDVGNLRWEEINRAQAGGKSGLALFRRQKSQCFDPVLSAALGRQQLCHLWISYLFSRRWFGEL